MYELNDIQFEEPKFEISSRKRTNLYVSGIVVSIITIVILLYGLIKVQKDLSSVVIQYELQNSSFGLSNSIYKKQTAELELKIEEIVQKQQFIKLEISAIRIFTSSAASIPVTFHQFLGENEILTKINTFNTQFICLKDDMYSIPIKLYNTIIPNRNVSLIYSFDSDSQIFKGFVFKLYNLVTDITPMIKLRSGMLNITLISTIILVFQFYFCEKTFSSSMAFAVGLCTLVVSNPLILRPTYNEIFDIYCGISYSYFRAFYHSAVPVIALSYLSTFDLLPIFYLFLFIFFLIIQFLLLCPIFSVHHQPFFINSGYSNYPYPYIVNFAAPLVTFLTFTGILLLFLAIYFVNGSEKYKILVAAIVQIYSFYTTHTTTFKVPFLPQIAKLDSQQGIFYDAFVQVISSLVFALLLTNVKINFE